MGDVKVGKIKLSSAGGASEYEFLNPCQYHRAQGASCEDSPELEMEPSVVFNGTGNPCFCAAGRLKHSEGIAIR